MTEREGYGCLMLMVPAGLYGDLVERAEAHGNSLAMEVLLMLERDVAGAGSGREHYTALPVYGREGDGDEVRG